METGKFVGCEMEYLDIEGWYQLTLFWLVWSLNFSWFVFLEWSSGWTQQKLLNRSPYYVVTELICKWSWVANCRWRWDVLRLLFGWLTVNLHYTYMYVLHHQIYSKKVYHMSIFWGNSAKISFLQSVNKECQSLLKRAVAKVEMHNLLILYAFL